MSAVFVAGHVIGNFVNPDGYASILPDWFGHLFLIYSQDNQLSQDDLIIRGGQDSGGNLVVQNNVNWQNSADGIDFWSGPDGANVGTSGERYYGYTQLSFNNANGENQSMDAIWSIWQAKFTRIVLTILVFFKTQIH